MNFSKNCILNSIKMNVCITIFNILYIFELLGYFQCFGNINNVGGNSDI